MLYKQKKSTMRRVEKHGSCILENNKKQNLDFAFWSGPPAVKRRLLLQVVFNTLSKFISWTRLLLIFIFYFFYSFEQTRFWLIFFQPLLANKSHDTFECTLKYYDIIHGVPGFTRRPKIDSRNADEIAYRPATYAIMSW